MGTRSRSHDRVALVAAAMALGAVLLVHFLTDLLGDDVGTTLRVHLSESDFRKGSISV